MAAALPLFGALWLRGGHTKAEPCYNESERKRQKVPRTCEKLSHGTSGNGVLSRSNATEECEQKVGSKSQKLTSDICMLLQYIGLGLDKCNLLNALCTSLNTLTTWSKAKGLLMNALHAQSSDCSSSASSSPKSIVT